MVKTYVKKSKPETRPCTEEERERALSCLPLAYKLGMKAEKLLGDDGVSEALYALTLASQRYDETRVVHVPKCKNKFYFFAHRCIYNHLRRKCRERSRLSGGDVNTHRDRSSTSKNPIRVLSLEREMSRDSEEGRDSYYQIPSYDEDPGTVEEIERLIKYLHPHHEMILRRVIWGGETYGMISQDLGVSKQAISLVVIAVLDKLRRIALRESKEGISRKEIETQKEPIKHRYNPGNTKLRDEQIDVIVSRYKPKCPINGAKGMSKEFGVTPQTILRIIRWYKR